jgi:hypothetical protein
MATCAVLGQGLGTAIAQAVKDGCHVSEVEIARLQQTLMDDDCLLPRFDRKVSALSLAADCSAEVVRDGCDRGEDHVWVGSAGESVCYTFDKPTPVREIRLVFDSDFDRPYDNMPCNYPLVQTKYHVPHTLIDAYRIEGESESGETYCIEVGENHQRLVRHKVDWRVKTVRFVPLTTHGCEKFRLFSFDVR